MTATANVTRAVGPLHHGTWAGYAAHRRRSEAACGPCLSAARERSRARAAARRDQGATKPCRGCGRPFRGDRAAKFYCPDCRSKTCALATCNQSVPVWRTFCSLAHAYEARAGAAPALICAECHLPITDRANKERTRSPRYVRTVHLECRPALLARARLSAIARTCEQCGADVTKATARLCRNCARHAPRAKRATAKVESGLASVQTKLEETGVKLSDRQLAAKLGVNRMTLSRYRRRSAITMPNAPRVNHAQPSERTIYAHKRHDEPLCEACRNWRREYDRDWARSKRAREIAVG